MPDLFLSPSLQTGNFYVSGETEAQIMGYIADALEPYLEQNGITYVRSKLPNTLANAIKQSNAQDFLLHLALHSNASPEGKYGQNTGIQGYYYPTSTKGLSAAQDIVNELKMIYPNPEKVFTVPTTTIAEVRKTRAPSVLMEIGYHDNSSDAAWIKGNIQNIARAICKGLCRYFNKQFRDVCTNIKKGITEADIDDYVSVCTAGTSLNIRSTPSTSAQRIGQMPKGEKAILLGLENSGWAKIRFNSIEGYSYGEYLCSCK